MLIPRGLGEVRKFLDDANLPGAEATFLKDLAIGGGFHELARLDGAGWHL